MDASIQAAFHAAGLDSWLPVLLAVHTLASALDAAIPQPQSGSHWLPLRKMLSLAALNVGNSTNANQPPLVTWLGRIAAMLVAILPPPAPAPVQQPKPAAPLFPPAPVRVPPVFQPVAPAVPEPPEPQPPGA